MIRMKQLVTFIPLILLFSLLQTACQNDENNDLDLTGLWRAAIAFSSCTPSDVCVAAGFQAGSTANAVMNLAQSGNNVNGTYTYEGAGITANVTGSFGGSQLLLDGGATNPFGQITVRLTGTVSNNTIQANVTHQISLIDGREGSVIGSGMFAKQ
jgi:hypothetical protein